MVVCFLCLLELYLSAWTCVQSVSSIFDCLLGSFLVGMFSLRRTTGALRRLGRAVMPCRHRAGWLFVSCLFKSSLAAVLRLSALWDLHGFGLACLYCLCLLQGLWGEAAGMVLLQAGCSAQGRYVFQLHLNALLLPPFLRDTTKHTPYPSSRSLCCCSCE